MGEFRLFFSLLEKYINKAQNRLDIPNVVSYEHALNRTPRAFLLKSTMLRIVNRTSFPYSFFVMIDEFGTLQIIWTILINNPWSRGVILNSRSM